MILLQNEFMKAVLSPDTLYNQESSSESDSSADGIGHFTLEYHDNPFTSFVRKLEQLIESDPQEAYRLLQMAVSDKLFSKKRQMEILSEKLDAVLDVLHMETENTSAFGVAHNSPATTVNQFTKSAWGLLLLKEPEDSPASPELAWKPKPLQITLTL